MSISFPLSIVGKLFSTALFCFISNFLFAQDLLPQSLVVASGEGKQSEIMLSWVVGNLVGTDLETPEAFLTEGAFPDPLFIEPLNVSLPILEIKIYPNPVRNVLNLDFSEAGQNYQVDVFDMMGRTVLHGASDYSNHILLDFGSLSLGTYQMQIMTEAQNAIRKFKIVKAY